MATFDSGDLALFTFDHDQITKLASYHVGTADGAAMAMDRTPFGWADRDHLFAAVDNTVVMVTASGMTPVATPPESALQAPQPQPDLGEGLDAGGLIVADGSAWWSRCAWGFVADGFQCVTYVSVQLWPGSARTVDSMGVAALEPSFPEPAAPPGYRAVANEKQFTCTSPDGRTTTLKSDDEHDQVHRAHWVSRDPPRLLLTYGQFGYANMIPTHWALHAGCAPKPLAGGTTVTLGPNGLWASDGDRLQLWRGSKLLGELPTLSVAFR